jgi:hypothetical protein
MSTVIDSLVSAINNAVKANGNKEITGNILQVVLDNMVGTLTQINGLLNVNQVNSKSDAYGSASAARQAVPDDLKTEGLVIAFKLSSGWIIEQNKDISGTWTADSSWQTLGPVSVSQNTITIGGEYAGEVSTTYDVTLHSGETFESLEDLLSDEDLATLIPANVRKGGMTIKFVQTTDNMYVEYFLPKNTWSASEADWEKVNLEKEVSSLVPVISGNNVSINGNTDGTLSFEIITYKKFNDMEVGHTLTLQTSPYANVGKVDITGINDWIKFNTLQTQDSTNRIAIVFTDAEDKILACASSTQKNYNYDVAFNTASIKNAKWAYFTYAPNATPLVVKYSKDGIVDDNKGSVNLKMLLGKSYINDYKNVSKYQFDDFNVGDVVTWNLGSNYRLIGCLNVNGRIDTIYIDKLMANRITTCYVIADKDNHAIYIDNTGVLDTNKAYTINLAQFPNAEWLYFVYGTGDSNKPTIISLGCNAENRKIDFSNTIVNNKFTANSIGDAFSYTSSIYSTLYVINIKGLKGGVFIKDALSSGEADLCVEIVKDGIILDKIYAFCNGGENSADIFVNLDKYIDADTMYISGAPNSEYLPLPTVFYKYQTPITRVATNEPHKGTLLLHFDGAEGTNDYLTVRKALVESYGMKGSFVIQAAMFVDNDFSKAWINSDLERQFWELINDGWDVALYPATVSTTYDEEGWKTWMQNAIDGLATHGIFNITTWAAGNLEINDDVINACKARGFKILRGGSGTYQYNVGNLYMSQENTEDTCIINKAFFVNYLTKIATVKNFIDTLCGSKTCGSLFTHQVLESTTDTNNCTISLFSDILEYIKTKVDSGELDVLNFREWYAKVNPADGHNFDYDRMQKLLIKAINS